MNVPWYRMEYTADHVGARSSASGLRGQFACEIAPSFFDPMALALAAPMTASWAGAPVGRPIRPAAAQCVPAIRMEAKATKKEDLLLDEEIDRSGVQASEGRDACEAVALRPGTQRDHGISRSESSNRQRRVSRGCAE